MAAQSFPDRDSSGDGGAGRGNQRMMLRVAVLYQGHVVDEHTFYDPERLTLGTGSRNTFILDDPTLPRSYRLFDRRRGRYELVLADDLQGGLLDTEAEDGYADFAAIRQDSRYKRRRKRVVVPLQGHHKGRVLLGDQALVFFFAPRPKVPPKPEPLPSFREPFWRSFDRTFWGTAGIAMALELLLAVGLHAMPEPKVASIDSINTRWAKLIVPERKPEDIKKPKPSDKGAKKPSNKSKAQAKAPVERPRTQEQKRQALRKSISKKGLLGILGTRGAGAGGAVADVFRQGGIVSDLDSAFAGISGVRVAGAVRKRGGNAGKLASIGGLATAGGGKVGLRDKQESVVGLVAAEAPDIDGNLDPDAIARVVRARMRMVQDCYERELKRNPNIHGKVEIEFTIADSGKVSEALVVSNTMGNQNVAQCIVNRIKRWRFPRPDGGSVTVTFPFLFSKQG